MNPPASSDWNSYLRKVAHFYDLVAQNVDLTVASGHLHVGLFDHTDESFASAQLRLVLAAASHVALAREQEVLDVGCGLGVPACVIAETFGVRMTGVTISAGQAHAGGRLAALRKLGQQVGFVVADAHRLPFLPGSFGAAFALESMLHMERKVALAQIRGSLRDHGEIVLCDWVATAELSEAEESALQGSMLMNAVSLPAYLQLFSNANYIDIQYEDWSRQVAPTYDRWAATQPRFANIMPLLREKLGYFCFWARAG